MRIFKCIITNKEMFCDNDRPLVLVDDVVYEVVGKYIEIGGEDYGMAANVDEDADEGATAEATAEEKKKVIDVIHYYNLAETSFDKKSFVAYIKGYMKSLNDVVKEKQGDEEAAKFQAGAQSFVKKIIGSFDDWQFFYNNSVEDYDAAMCVACKWEGETPKFYFWAHGLKSEKV